MKYRNRFRIRSACYPSTPGQTGGTGLFARLLRPCQNGWTLSGLEINPDFKKPAKGLGALWCPFACPYSKYVAVTGDNKYFTGNGARAVIKLRLAYQIRALVSFSASLSKACPVPFSPILTRWNAKLISMQDGEEENEESSCHREKMRANLQTFQRFKGFHGELTRVVVKALAITQVAFGDRSIFHLLTRPLFRDASLQAMFRIQACFAFLQTFAIASAYI